MLLPFRFLCAALLPLVLGGCGRSGEDVALAADGKGSASFESGHERMRSELAGIAAQYAQRPLVRELRQRWAARTPEGDRTDPLEAWRLRYELGRAELREGNVERAIDLLRQATKWVDDVDFQAAARTGRVLRLAEAEVYYTNMTWLQLGVAYLRQAEVENCCQLYNADSCILPFREGGRHTRPDGARNASACCRRVIETRPERVSAREAMECQLAARWLWNVAAMALGSYPDDVPPELVVDLAFLGKGVDFPRFVNIGPKLGLDTLGLSGGVVADDFDGDDHLDILTSTWDRAGEMRFFVNQRDGSFEDRTSEAGLRGFFGGLNMVQADYDNDGDTDVFVLRGAWLRSRGRHPNSLLRNDGGRFTDVSYAAGVAEPAWPTKTGAWADYDLDGDLDLFVGNESSPDLHAPSQLFQNAGDGTFVDVAPAVGLTVDAFCNGSSWGDYDEDGDPDLYVSVGTVDPVVLTPGGGPNCLFRNDSATAFIDVAEEAGVQAPLAGFACWFWDFDNDGHLDIYAAASSGPVAALVSDRVRLDRDRLYRGDGSGRFVEVSEAVGLTYPTQPMGANFGELNGDGFPDVYLGTGNFPFSELRPNVMFVNRGGKRFENVTLAGGFGHLQKGHGIAFADFDNDGDNDVYAQMGGAWPADVFEDALFENPGFGNHWITIHLVGVRSNRSAIGARIRADIVEDGQVRSVWRWVNSGGSFGCNPLRQNLGLGRAERIERLEITWPRDGAVEAFEGVPMDRAYRIVEGEGRLLELDLVRLRLGEPALR